jgi:anti-sigma regulatory factor (Ser/Thr protein kinase)
VSDPLVDVELPPTLDAPAKARASLTPIASLLGAKTFDDLVLLTSELVTNSVKYGPGGAGIQLVATRRRASVRVEVRDAGPGFDPSVGHPTLHQESGWGLYLVKRLADRWGVGTDGHTIVWFELPLRQPASANNG